jgi:hypothetical protein
MGLGAIVAALLEARRLGISQLHCALVEAQYYPETALTYIQNVASRNVLSEGGILARVPTTAMPLVGDSGTFPFATPPTLGKNSAALWWIESQNLIKNQKRNFPRVRAL